MSRKWMLRVSVAALVASALVGTATIAGAEANTDHIWAGEQLVGGAYQTSTNGMYRLIQQADGNLVEYKKAPSGKYNEFVWGTGTSGYPGAVTFVQKDGNLVVRRNSDPKSQALWSSNTATPNVSHLTVQPDGNVVLYTKDKQALWASQGLTKSAGAIKDDYPARWGSPAQDTVFDDWQMYNRECTSFVAFRVQTRNGFNVRQQPGWNAMAYNWDDYFRSRTDSTPRPGAVAQTDRNGGHVAWVAEVKGGMVHLEDYNSQPKNNPGRYNHYWDSASNYRYIHLNN